MTTDARVPEVVDEWRTRPDHRGGGSTEHDKKEVEPGQTQPAEDGSGRKYLLAAARFSELADDAVERRRYTLRPADFVVLLGSVPKQQQRPALRAVRQQAAQRELYRDVVDRAIRRPSGRRA